MKDILSSKRKKKRIIIIAVILAIILLIGAVAAGVTGHFLGKMNRVDEEVTIAPDDEDFETDEARDGDKKMKPGDVKWDPSEPLGDTDFLNILLVGQDRREGEGRQRSDTMILVSFNKDTKEVSVISFLRDLYVQIPGYSDNRLNAAYVFGGYELLASTLTHNFGITVDGFFEVDFYKFIDIIDRMGGLDIELTPAEASIVGVSSGKPHLDGEQTLRYARIRKLDSDFGRTNRQRNVLIAAFNKVKTMSMTEIFDIIDDVLPAVTTSFTNGQIISMATRYIPFLPRIKVSTYSIPGDGMYENAYIRGMSVLVPDLSEIRTALKMSYLPFEKTEE